MTTGPAERLIHREPARASRENEQPMTQNSLDYQRVEKAITFLQSRFLEQPDLEAVARAVHLSEYHFQRLFTRWAGVSPKRFLQFLTIEHAKGRLAASQSLLDTTLDSGLSSPGRLHDLFVSMDAVTPGEFKARGAGLQIEYGIHSTPFGPCLLGLTARGVCWLSFLEGGSARAAVAGLEHHWRGASLAEGPGRTAPVADRIFSALHQSADACLSLLVMGTNFQIQVWRALLAIPRGAVVTYDAVGQRIGARNSARAIGNAVAHNAIAYLIPCHRVIRRSGLLGGYRWGPVRKQAILGWEAAHDS